MWWTHSTQRSQDDDRQSTNLKDGSKNVARDENDETD